jgi:hypothetical protein
VRELPVSPDWPGLPSEDDITTYLADINPGHAGRHPYPAERRTRPTWRGGPDIGHDADRDYFYEQDDQ